ncbi:MAG: copper-translocating P-type ATPase [Daejeonella sp.]|uniref:copper-translocating P-type ATPase n=1 Tax=Daejeonella sp. TaxID=2805397 RepID=UPI002734B2FB|nr:copper-translocating P-type ATPase [Daejeonella sp.]MDP3468589.1 copper-translocating P-type ATPase [Daejeonella sp.]
MDHHQHGHIHPHGEHGNNHAGLMNEHPNSHVVDEHAGHQTSDFLKRFWISLILTIPVLLLSEMIQHWFGFHIAFPGDKFVLLGLSLILFIYGGKPFLIGMLREIKQSNPGMMTLIGVAILVAFVYSTSVIFGLKGMDFFWELATLIDIMLLGHYFEMRSQHAASRALESLVALLPSDVHVERKGVVVDLPLKELRNQDIILIKPGEKIPADGKIISGHSFVNESMLTGESLPVRKQKEDLVIGGSINGDGSIKVLVTGTGEQSYLNKVINMVQGAQAIKSRTQNLANKVAKWLTYVSLSIGIITFIVWFSKDGDMAFALERMVTVMVTSCPHALGVAIPLVVAISTSQAAVNGLLIRNRTAFENSRNLSLVIFDKTGTLTEGSHGIQRIIVIDKIYSENDILQYAAALQQNSEHYIAQGVKKSLDLKKLELWPSTEFEYLPGIGIKGKVKGKEVIAVGPNYFRKENMPVPEIPEEINQSSETVNFLNIDGKTAGIITLSDTIRPSSKAAIEELKSMGIKSYLLTGDNEHVAKSVSDSLGMDGFLANVLPDQKQQKVLEFQQKGEIVAMTGDGVNDAPALAQANVGIAVGSGTDVAAETADILLVNSDPRDIVKIIRFGRATYKKMIQNLFWAVGYNIVAIPLAAGVLYPGFLLSPAAGAVLMSISTIIVAINAQLLKRSL